MRPCKCWSRWVFTQNRWPSSGFRGQTFIATRATPNACFSCPKDLSSDSSEGLCPLPIEGGFLGHINWLYLEPSLSTYGAPGSFPKKSPSHKLELDLENVWWYQCQCPSKTQVPPPSPAGHSLRELAKSSAEINPIFILTEWIPIAVVHSSLDGLSSKKT